jgi:hypothetical protein
VAFIRRHEGGVSGENLPMSGRERYHCEQRLEEGQPHDCWTTTEAALTRDLSDDFREAWERLRERVVSFGEQRIYASHHSIMFSQKTCYFFVRPKQNNLELCVFLGRRLEAPQVRRVDQASKSKLYHLIRITHRDQVEPPMTDWPQEAYDLSDEPAKPRVSKSSAAAERPSAARKREALRSGQRLRERPDAHRIAVWRSNWPAFAGFAHRFPARLKGSRTVSQHSLLRNEYLSCLRPITMATGALPFGRQPPQAFRPI